MTHLSAPPRARGSYQPPVLAQTRWQDRLRVWWRELDKWLLGLLAALMTLGTIAVAAASPASADQLSTASTTLDPLMFFRRHVLFQLLGLALMLGLSFLSREEARRLGIVLAAVMLVLMVLVLIPGIGAEKKGSRRWIEFGFSLQPSEFLKPGFAIVMAWVLSWRLRDPSLPVIGFATAILALVVALLMAQPNLGDAVLFAGIWLVALVLAGAPLRQLGALVGAGLAGLALAYVFYDNARHRLDSFLGGGTAFDQVDLAHRTLTAGGWTGTGLWLGVRKMNLPEAHTDYIFSVIGEEFGLIACAVIVLLYCAIVIRAVVRMASEENLFAMLAAVLLAAQFGGQAFINIMVNLRLFPSKGMTLPLVSYGGSSILAECFALGLLLAITRRNPFLARQRGGLRDWIERKETRA